MAHRSRQLDDTIHQRVRLGILAILTEAKRVDFTYLREGGRPRTWIHATRRGRSAFASEVKALREIVARFDGSRTGS